MNDNQTNFIFKIIEINRSNKDEFEKFVDFLKLLEDPNNVIANCDILFYIFKDTEIKREEIITH